MMFCWLQNTLVMECILLKYFINEWMINTIWGLYGVTRSQLELYIFIFIYEIVYKYF